MRQNHHDPVDRDVVSGPGPGLRGTRRWRTLWLSGLSPEVNSSHVESSSHEYNLSPASPEREPRGTSGDATRLLYEVLYEVLYGVLYDVLY